MRSAFGQRKSVSFPKAATSDAEEFYRLLDGQLIDDADVFNERLTQWENYYNFDRPHGGLDGHTPYERLLQKTAQRTKTPT